MPSEHVKGMFKCELCLSFGHTFISLKKHFDYVVENVVEVIANSKLHLNIANAI